MGALPDLPFCFSVLDCKLLQDEDQAFLVFAWPGSSSESGTWQTFTEGGTRGREKRTTLPSRVIC